MNDFPEHNDTMFFKTKEEAKAFVQGIEYVNDSSIEIIGTMKDFKGYTVLILDKDKE